jgi:hypothetical protein
MGARVEFGQMYGGKGRICIRVGQLQNAVSEEQLTAFRQCSAEIEAGSLFGWNPSRHRRACNGREERL